MPIEALKQVNAVGIAVTPIAREQIRLIQDVENAERRCVALGISVEEFHCAVTSEADAAAFRRGPAATPREIADRLIRAKR